MRTVVISCDRCGKEIKGYPVKIVTEYVDRQTGDIWPDNDERLPEWAEKTLDKDFCEDCTRKIVRFALGGLKENQDFKKAVDEMVNSDTPTEVRMIRYQAFLATRKGIPIWSP